jgi:ABC-type transporter Mla subunit MlaD
MKKMSVQRLVKELEAVRAKLAKDRDDLRALLEEYGEILDSADRANSSLEDAIGALSEYA